MPGDDGQTRRREAESGGGFGMSGEGRITLPEDKAYFSFGHKATRAVWAAVWLIGASWTPKPFAPWRRFLLRAFGATIKGKSDVRGSARVWYPPNLHMEPACILAEGVECYNMAPVHLHENTIISQRAFLCGGTHDHTIGTHPLVARPITIGPHAWVASEAFVGPGAIVAEGCVVGARAVVNGRLEPWGVYAGNPARRIRERKLDWKDAG